MVALFHTSSLVREHFQVPPGSKDLILRIQNHTSFDLVIHFMWSFVFGNEEGIPRSITSCFTMLTDSQKSAAWGPRSGITPAPLEPDGPYPRCVLGQHYLTPRNRFPFHVNSLRPRLPLEPLMASRTGMSSWLICWQRDRDRCQGGGGRDGRFGVKATMRGRPQKRGPSSWCAQTSLLLDMRMQGRIDVFLESPS